MNCLALLVSVLLSTLSFTGVDRSFTRETYAACRDSLTVMLPRAADNKEKAEVLWRLSRVTLMLGEQAPSKEEKRVLFGQGIRYADEAIAADPANVRGYMWHCANTGRECQTRGLKEQVAAVPVLQQDLETILDRYGRTDVSEAWQALSELFLSHPFKPDEKGINYARKAADTIPASELRLTTYLYLARILYARNWSASKRAAAIASDVAKFKTPGQKNTDRFGYYDGAAGPEGTARWTGGKPLAALSDREEALAVVEYAIGRYDTTPSLRVKMDVREYKALRALRDQWTSN